MEFLKRKHFSLWISLLLTTWLTNVCGLQGLPTWMCLGIKSPFIEFRAEIEILANTSVSLNVTKDDQALMHEQGLQKLGTFIQPIDLRNSTTGYIKSNLTKKVTYNVVDRRKGVTEHPITEEMNRKEIELIEDESDQETDLPSINNEDRKYIIPMALKNPTAEPKKSPPQPGQDFSTNIEDLKNHILMLQNKTKNDKNFQSKFVVFPSLQRERNGGEQNRTQQVTISKVGPQRQQLASSQLPLPKPVQNTPKPSAKSRPSEGLDEDHVANVNRGKITITPQVLLLNDQTPPDDEDEEFDRRRSEDRKDGRVNYARRRNFRKTTTPSTTISSTLRPSRRPSKRQRLPGGSTDRRNRNKRKNCKNNDRPRCQRRRQQQLAMSDSGNSNNASMSGSNRDSWGDSMDKINYSRSRTEGDSLWPSAASPSSASGSLSPSLSSLATSSILSSGERRRPIDDEQLKLSRSIRSHSRRNAGGSMKSGSGSSYDEGGRTTTRDFIIPIGNVINNNQSLAYKEKIDLNPDLCYQVGGLTYGQQKLCVLHTNIMPPISRGARSAIQECKHQLKNRRWNCSTTEDNTVFGPMTSIGSPEMAFIHALASAAATSFIARACRDGQLASCGCSRSSRPKQLNDDWTWGGCGDDLEFAYKFSQNFIDVREKERKRGTRGLVSVPPRSKFDEKLLAESEMGTTSASYDSTGGSNVSKDNNGNHNNNRSETSSSSFDVGEYSNGNRNNNNNNNNYHKNDNPPSVFKPEDLMELQEKLKEKTKEILNTKLQEKEMLELQENIKWEILNSKVFNLEHHSSLYSGKKQHQRNGGFAAGGIGGPLSSGTSQATLGRIKSGSLAKARSLMNLHNNEAGRRAVIKKTRITCKCHGVSGSCSLITCWQQLSSIREIGDYLREKYDEATQVKLNKRGRLQVKDPRYKVPTAHDLVYLDESPDWCRINRQLQWPGTHGRICNKTSSGLNGCAILCCGRGYNTKKIVVRERCNCKFHWCCQVKCEICVKVIEEHTCK